MGGYIFANIVKKQYVRYIPQVLFCFNYFPLSKFI